VFKKVNSISNDVSSAQTYYEQKIASIQEDLQGLGEWLAPGPGGLLHVSLHLSGPQLLDAASQGLKHLHFSGPGGPPELRAPLLSQGFGEGQWYGPKGGVGGLGLFGELAARRWQEQGEGGSWRNLVASGWAKPWLRGAHL